MWLLSHVWLFATLLDYSPPGSSVHGNFQARILEWFSISSSRRSSQSRDLTWVSCVSCIAGGFFTQWDIREAPDIFIELFKVREFAASFSYNLMDFYLIIQLSGIFFFFNFFLVAPHSMWDLNSPTRDWSHTCVGKWLSWTTREVLSGF